MNIEELKQKIAEEEAAAHELRRQYMEREKYITELRIKAITVRVQKRERAKEQLYFACEKLCDAAMSARHYCPETVQQTIDDSVRHWTEIQQEMN